MISGAPDPLAFAPLSWHVQPLFNRPLCLTPDAAALLTGDPGALGAYGRGEAGDDDRRPAYRLEDGVAPIGVHGALVNRESWLTRASGVTTYQGIASALRQAAADPLARSIVLDIDSPGGEAAGAMELAELVREAADRKPVTAFVNSLAASAGYWIATGASEIVATPMATLGSIGVVYLHLDHSAAFAAAGIRPTLLHAGAQKIDGAETHPLAAEARARIQAQIDEVYDLFAEGVGKHRPRLGAAGAKRTEAAVFIGARAVAAGLADRGAASPASLAAPASRPGTAAPAAGRRALSDASPASSVVENRGAIRSAEARGHDLALAEVMACESAKAEAAAAVKARIAAILECEEAKDRPTFARHIAFATRLSVDRAKEILAIAEPEKQLGSRMAMVPNPKIRPDCSQRSSDPQAEADAVWAEIAAKRSATLPRGAVVPAAKKRQPDGT